MNQEEKKEMVRLLVELIREDQEIRSAVFELICTCPNIVTQY